MMRRCRVGLLLVGALVACDGGKDEPAGQDAAVDAAVGDAGVSILDTGPDVTQMRLVSIAPRLLDPVDVILDPVGDRALVSELSRDAIISVDLATGHRKVLSGCAERNCAGPSLVGAGLSFSAPGGLAMGCQGKQLLAGNLPTPGNSTVLMNVDLDSGRRTVVASEDFRPHHVALGCAVGQAFMTGIRTDLVAIDLASGDRRTVAPGSFGAVAFDEKGGRVIAGKEGGLVAVDPNSGDVTLISGCVSAFMTEIDGIVQCVAGEQARGIGPGIRIVHAIGIANDRALVLATGLATGRQFIWIDLTTGNRTKLAGAMSTDGLALADPTGFALDVARGRALVVDKQLRALVSLDLDNGARTIVSSTMPTGFVDEQGDVMTVGTPDRRSHDNSTAPAIGAPTDMALDPVAGTLLVTDPRLGIWSVNAATGERQILSGCASSQCSDGRIIGPGPPLASGAGFRPTQVALQTRRRWALVTNSLNLATLFGVDVVTGRRFILSDVETGSGDDLVFPRAVGVDSTRDLAVVVTGRGVATVDLLTGNRQVLYGNLIGNPRGIAVDSGRANVIVAAKEGLLEVSLRHGGSRMLDGSGPRFGAPADVAHDPVRDRAVVVDDGIQGLFAVDLDSGNRVLLSGCPTALCDSGLVGSGPTFSTPLALVIDGEADRAFVLLVRDTVSEFMEVDLTTGARSMLGP